MTYLRDGAEELRQPLLRSSASEARTYLFENGHIGSMLLPYYYRTSGLKDITLHPLDQRPHKYKPAITATLDLHSPKGHLGWRRFSILHPYIYWHIVNEMTADESSWKMIKDILTRETSIAVYSTPQLPTTEKQSGLGIKAWLRFAEDDLICDSVNYSHLLVTDISNFYPSIYTHSIAWALHGRSAIQSSAQNRNDPAFLGNRLDTLFQYARNTQTNGIPIGSFVSDIIAECILADVDTTLSSKIAETKIECIAARYRDDYRFLCKSQSDAARLCAILSKILHDNYDLTLNSDKTKIHDDIITGAFRPWARELKHNPLLTDLSKVTSDKTATSKYLVDLLMSGYEIQRKFPTSHVINTVLSHVIAMLEIDNFKLKINHSKLHVAIALLRQISKLREDATPQVMVILSNLLVQINDVRRKGILMEIIEQFSGDKDRHYQELWLHRLLLAHDCNSTVKVFQNTDNHLLKLTMNNYRNDYEMFDNQHIYNESDKEELRNFSLLDRDRLRKIGPELLRNNEINVFGY